MARKRKTKRGNGEGTVYENVARGRWEAKYVVGTDDQGRPIRKMVTAPTRAEAVTKLNAAMGDATEGRDRARADLSLGRFLDDWARDVLPGSVADSTAQQYRDVIRLYVKPILGRKRLAALRPSDVTAMVRQLADEGKAPNTQRLARSVLRRALRWAENEGLIARNVAAVSFGVRVPAPEGRTMTVDEARAFLESITEHRLAASWVTMLSLGLRRGELLGLAWSDIKLSDTRSTLTVRRTLQRIAFDPRTRSEGGPKSRLVIADTKTSTSRRTVVLPSPTVTALRAHRISQAEERLAAGPLWQAKPLGLDLVFRNEDGTALDPDTFRKLTYRVSEGAGLGRWSPHELRHVAASLLIAMGVPLKTISETLGHSSIRVTADVYSHLMDDARDEAADAMSKALG